jgi:hypothetical protein
VTDRLIRDGSVAVLYSPGFGAGWSTWNPEHFEEMLFDPQIADIRDHAEEGWIDKVQAVAMMKYPDAYLDEESPGSVVAGRHPIPRK